MLQSIALQRAGHNLVTELNYIHADRESRKSTVWILKSRGGVELAFTIYLCLLVLFQFMFMCCVIFIFIFVNIKNELLGVGCDVNLS